MPLDRSNAHAQENGNSGPKGLKLVLRLDKSKSVDPEKDSPASNDRPKRIGTAKASPAADDSHYSADKKIPKKHEEVVDHDEHRPSRKRKSTQDSNFVFDPIYSNKKGEEDDEEEEEAEHTKPKKKTHRHESIPTPPLTDHDTHSGFKLKLKLPKPMLPDTPDHSKIKKAEVSSGEGKKKKRTGEEMEDVEAISPRPTGGVKLKIKTNDTPHSLEKRTDSTKKATPATPTSVTKKLSPPKREELEKKELKIEPRERRERPKPEPKTTPVALDEDSVKMRKHLSGILAQLIKLDKQMYFMEPVTEDIAPQYFSIIHHPMDFKTMRKKLKDGNYNSVDALQSDFQLICNNCMTYNPAATTYAREAKRMLTTGNRLIEKFIDGTPTPSTTEHKPDAKKDSDKTPTRQALPVTTPNKNFQAKPSPSTNTPNRSAPTPPNSLGVAFPISSGQLSSMQHPITPQQSPYPTTPPMRKPPAAYPPLTPPYSQRLSMQNPNLPPPMRPPPSMPIQKSMSTNSIFQRPNMGPPAPPPLTPNAPPRPQNPVGKPGSRPPVVSMGDNQATQTQAMYPEQPKRKYVKLPVEEPPKPAPPLPVAKTPAKLVAKVGNVPLVSPANIPGSFVYSMYMPRFESDAASAKPSSTETTPTTPTPTPTPAPATPPTTSTTSTTSTTPTTSTTSTSTTSTSSTSSTSATSATSATSSTDSALTAPLELPPPTIKTASGNTAINLASINYISNYVSVPSLHNAPPTPSAHDADDAWLRAPAKRVEENVGLMEEIAQDCLDSMDADTRTQMLGFFNSLVQTPILAQPLAFPKCATQALIPIKPIHQTRPSPATPTPTSPPPTSPASITGNALLDAELAQQMAKLDSLELTSQDLKQLQGLQLNVDLSSFLPSDSASTPVTVTPNSPENSTTSTTTTTTTTTTTAFYSSVSSPPTSPPITPATPTGPTDRVKASKVVQEILDKNLEHLWSLQLLQHERVANAPSDGELKLASQICDGLFVLGTSIPPSMLTTKEAVRSAIEQSGLLTGKYRHMRV